MTISNLLKQAIEIELSAKLGDNIHELKITMKRLSKKYQCKVTLFHNDHIFVSYSGSGIKEFNDKTGLYDL